MSSRYNRKLSSPNDVLEQKARFLEETLEKMQQHADYVFRTLKRTERKTPEDTALIKELKDKLKDLNKGILEVHEKAHVLWTEISTQAKKGT